MKFTIVFLSMKIRPPGPADILIEPSDPVRDLSDKRYEGLW